MTDKTRFDISIILPDIEGEADPCVERLLKTLRERNGITEAHGIPAEGDKSGQLCLHYDQSRLSLLDIRTAVQSAGAKLTSQYGHVFWNVRGIGSARRARTVGDLLQQAEGVMEAGATAAGVIRIEFDRNQTTEDKLLALLAGMGVQSSGKVDSPV